MFFNFNVLVPNVWVPNVWVPIDYLDLDYLFCITGGGKNSLKYHTTFDLEKIIFFQSKFGKMLPMVSSKNVRRRFLISLLVPEINFWNFFKNKTIRIKYRHIKYRHRRLVPDFNYPRDVGNFYIFIDWK